MFEQNNITTLTKGYVFKHFLKVLYEFAEAYNKFMTDVAEEQKLDKAQALAQIGQLEHQVQTLQGKANELLAKTHEVWVLEEKVIELTVENHFEILWSRWYCVNIFVCL